MIDADDDLESERENGRSSSIIVEALTYNCGRFASVLLADPAA